MDELKKKAEQALALTRQGETQKNAVTTSGMAQVVNTFRAAIAQMNAAAASMGGGKGGKNNNWDLGGDKGGSKGGSKGGLPPKGGGAGSGKIGAGGGKKAFAAGGVVDEPTNAILGEKLPPGFVEVAYPLPRKFLENAQAGGGGGTTIQYNQNAPITIGGGADGAVSQAYVKSEIGKALTGVVLGVRNATG
jgi:hypothetical protein